MRTRIDFGSRDQGIFKIPVVGLCGGLALWLAAESVCVLSITCKVKRQMNGMRSFWPAGGFKYVFCVCAKSRKR